MTKTTTPGYRELLDIYFTSKNGKRRAWRMSYSQFRAFPVKLADAELWVATGLATEIPGNPLRP